MPEWTKKSQKSKKKLYSFSVALYRQKVRFFKKISPAKIVLVSSCPLLVCIMFFCKYTTSRSTLFDLFRCPSQINQTIT